MANARMFPPGDGKHPTMVVNGRSYTAALGSFVDAPSQDAHLLNVNGWTRAGGSFCTVGTTAGRPTFGAGGQPLTGGLQYIDTTLGVQITWDALGNVWRSNITGSAV